MHFVRYSLLALKLLIIPVGLAYSLACQPGAHSTGAERIELVADETQTNFTEETKERLETPVDFPSSLQDVYDALLEAQKHARMAEKVSGEEAEDYREREIRALRRASRLHPDSGYIRALISERYLRQGETEKAEREVEKALSKDPDVALSHVVKGKLEMQAGKNEQAQESFERALEIDPRQLDALLFIGSLYEKEKSDYEQANEFYKRAARLFPEQSPRLFPAIARNYFRMGQFEKAVEYFSWSIQYNPFDFGAYQLMAESLAQLEKFDEALEVYRTLLGLQREPEARAEVEKLLGDTYRRAGRLKEAYRSYERAIALDPEQVALRRNLGLLAFYLGNYKEAIDHLSRYWKKNPEDWEVLQELGIAHALVDEDDQAIALLETLREKDKATTQTYVTLLNLYGRKGDAEKIEQLKEEAIQEGVSEEQLYLTLGSLFYDQYQNEEAKSYLNKVLDLNPENKMALIQLALLYDRMDQLSRIEEVMNQALEIDPDFPEALNLLGYAYADRGVRLEKAEELIQKAIDQAPTAGFIIDSLGWVYYRQGRYEEALKQLQRAKALMGDPPDWVVLDHLGDVYDKLGKNAQAVEAWKQAIDARKKQAHPNDPEVASDVEKIELKIEHAESQVAADPTEGGL